MKILFLSSYTRKQKYKSDNCIRSEDFETPARLERRIQELSGYSVPAGEIFTGPLHTQLRQGLTQIRKHEQYGENTLDLYFPGYACRVDRKQIPVSENDRIVPFDIAPPPRQELKALEYDETGFLESMETLIEGYDLVLSILRWQDIVRLERVFEVERATSLIFLIARSNAKHVADDVPNIHAVYTTDLVGEIDGVTNYNHQGAVFKILCKAACLDGFPVFEQIKQNPQRLIEIVRSQ